MQQSSSHSPRFGSLSRRTLLKLFGIGAVGGTLGYSRVVKPQPTIVQQDFLDLPHQLSRPKNVVVVGAGLAGLACAYELSVRGFAVTLLEKSPQLGGKIASWPIQVGEESFMMEHGFHGFFPQYYNLNGLVEELAIQHNFVSLESYAVAFKDEKYLPEVFRPNHSAFPWNIVDLAIASPNCLRWGIDLANFKHWQVFREIGGFKIPNSFQRLDEISVAEWVAEEFPKGLYDLYFLPFAKSSLNAPDVLSAGELMQFFHFYFFGNPEGLAFNGTRQDMGTSLVQPIAKAIAQNGGQVITEATVSRIQWQGDRIISLSYTRGNAGSSVPLWVDRNPHLQDPGTTYYGAGDRLFAVRDGEKEALSLTCTHQGCTVKRQENGMFLCPCHGSLFAKDGQVLSGPAQRDLARFQIVQRQDARLQLAAATSQTTIPQTLEADYYVFATDVPGVQHLFRLSEGGGDRRVAEPIEQLAVADPFAVARFWFDRDFPWPHSHFTSLSGYALTDSITLYHRIQDEYIAWHQKTGGSAIELHAYCYKEADFPDQETLLQTFEAELYQIVPELAQATLLHRELVNQKNFSGYPPGSYQNRPETCCGLPNLFFAGDWVKMPFPCGLMERATSSGFLAANAILHKEGLRRRSLLSVNPAGILTI